MGLVAVPVRRPQIVEPENELAAMVAATMQSRQTILPKRLIAPGPAPEQLAMILNAAATAPDHGQLLPWRFVLVPQDARFRLADVFGAALIARDALATPVQIGQAREKAYRSPLLLLVVVDRRCGDAAIDLSERIVSAGCAVQNMLLMATALGFGSALTSGQALKFEGLRTLFGLAEGERALCFVSVGTAQSRKLARLRPAPREFVTRLPAVQTAAPGEALHSFYPL
ncbi:MAG: nitroreductase [Polaromonas sp.]|nr:nitroreductase [Polaromonas sp.]